MSAVLEEMDDSTESTKGKKAKAPVEQVKMQDGRVVEFPGKRDLVKNYYPDDEKATVKVVLDFRNGETRVFYPHPSLLLTFAGHGAIQKLGDELADPKLTDIDDKVAAIDALMEQLNEGKWSVRREGDGFAGTSVLLKALVEKSGKTVEEIKAWLKGKTQPEKMALRGSAALKPIVDRIEAEKVAKSAKVDTTSLLAEII